MSLTTEIENADSLTGRFLRDRFPQIRDAASVWRRQLGNPMPLVTPEVRTGFPYAVIGQALDYRIRYYFGHTPIPKLVAAKAMHRLLRALVGSSVFADRPSIREVWAARRDLKVGRDSRLPIPRLAYDFFLSLESILTDSQPAKGHLSAAQERLLCQHCYVLALFDQIYRNGIEINSPLYQLQPGAQVQDLLALVPAYCSEDLCRLSRVFLERHSADLVRPAILNPTFAGSRDVGGADADLILDGCLIELKTVLTPKFDARLFYQLMGYVLLDYDDQYGISEAGVYWGRHGVMTNSPVEGLLRMLSGCDCPPLDEVREDFRVAIARPLAASGNNR